MVVAGDLTQCQKVQEESPSAALLGSTPTKAARAELTFNSSAV
jgi:hypothetical protein